jgi:hypothetical protein
MKMLEYLYKKVSRKSYKLIFMKKYFPGSTAIVFALISSAFTKPFSFVNFYLIADPISAGIVNNPNNWRSSGTHYGRCDQTPEDIACTISIDNSATMQKYYHTSGLAKFPNDFAFANAQSPKQDYIEITEAVGASPDRKIVFIAYKHFDSFNYVTVSKTKGTDYDFLNGRD